jgi:PAS domain S-box-containing protein
MKDEGKTKEQLINELTELRERIAPLEAAEEESKHVDVKHTRGMDFLSRTAIEFVELPSEENIYQFIAEKLKELVGSAVVVINSFDKVSDSFCTRAVVGIGKHTKGILKIIGRDPLGMTYTVTDAEARRALLSGNLVEGPRGLYELSFGKIPQSSCRVIEKLLGLGGIYVIGFTWKGDLFGSAVIITRQGSRGRPGLRSRDLIETFIYQAAVALQRRQAEEALQKAHDELERRVEERTDELFKANEQLKEEIEERNRAEGALRRSEQRYRSLVEAAMDVIFSLSKDGIITSLNPAFETITGWSRAEWLGKSFKPLVHPHDLPSAMQLFHRVLQGEKTPIYELRVVSKAGEYLTGQFTSTPQIQDGKVVSILGIARDITGRKKAENEISKLSSAVEQSIDGIAIGDLEAKLIYVNDAFARMHGYSSEEMIGMKVVDLHNEKQMDEYKISMYQIKIQGSWVGEIDHIRRDGTAFPTFMTVTLLKDEEEKPIGILAVCRDITDRRRAEEELRIKDSAIASSINAIAMADLEGDLVYVNDSFLKQWGYDDEKEVLEKSVVKFWQIEDTALEVIEALHDRGGWIGELAAMKKDGSLFDVQVSASMVGHETGRPLCMMASFVDISKRKRAEKALREREAELEIKTKGLEEVNTALRVLLRKRDEDRKELEEKVVSNVRELVVPFAEKVKQGLLDPKHVAYMNILESNLNDIISPFLRNLSARYVNLTPTEIRVAHLIKEGKTTKEIAGLMTLSPRTIETHRKNLRKKLAIEKNKGNLRSQLLSLK